MAPNFLVRPTVAGSPIISADGVQPMTGQLKLDSTLLLSDGTQDYLVFSSGLNKIIQGQGSGQSAVLRLGTMDSDGTDAVAFQLYNRGDISASTNFERLQLLWNSATSAWEVISNASGTGTARPIALYTGTDTDQFVIATDGKVGIQVGTSPAAQLDIAVAANAVSALQVKRNNTNATVPLIYVEDSDTGNINQPLVAHFVSKNSMNGPIVKIESLTSNTNTLTETLFVEATSTGVMADGFGPYIAFVVKDNSAADNQIASINAIRSGADNSGSLNFATLNAGSGGVRLSIDKTGQITQTVMEVAATREQFFKMKTSGAGNACFLIFNQTTATNALLPALGGLADDATRPSLSFEGFVTAALDTGTAAIVRFDALTTSTAADPPNGTLSAVATRPLFSWANNGSVLMQMLADGKLSIGQLTPLRMLHVGSGGGTPFQGYEGIFLDGAGIAQMTVRNEDKGIEVGLFAHSTAAYMGTWTNHPLVLRTNNALVLTLTAAGDIQPAEGTNLVFGTTTGTQIGTATSQKLAFYGATPIIKPSAYTQTYATAAKTVPNATALTPPAGGTGTAAGGYDTAANRNLMIASITATQADVLALKKVVTAIIDDLQALGLFA